MVQDTYLSRVRRVFTELVKDNQDSIELELLIEQVRACSASQGRYSRRHIDAALHREARAKRIIVVRDAFPSVNVTDPGKKFYSTEEGSILLYPSDHNRLKRMSVAQIEQYTNLLKGVLIEVHGIIRDLRPYSMVDLSLENIPVLIQQLRDTLAELEDSNTELQLDFAFEQKRRRELPPGLTV